MRIGVKSKLILFTASLLFIVISILSAFVLTGIKKYQDEEIKNILFKQKDMFEQYFSEKINESGSYDKSQLARGSIFNKPWLRNIPSCIYDTNGNMFSGFNNDTSLEENECKKEMINYAIDGKVAYRTVNNIVYFYSPIKYNEDTVAILELKYQIEDRIIFYNKIRNMFYVTGSLSLVLGVILGIIYFSQFTKEIYIMRNYVNNIQNGNFNKVNFSKRKDELGELSTGLVCMSNTIKKNINDLKIERDSLSLAVKKLKKMGEEQKEFIGNVTHEFKTPMTVIKASGDLIKMYPDDLELIEDMTDKISEECDRLESLVGNVLELSALEKYDFEIEKKEVNLKEVLNEICKRMSGRIRRNNLSLKCNLNNIVINIDEESLKHIVINLIDNAIKYNRANGNISVKCYKGNNMACIEVADDGMGIEEEKLKKIFDPFYRVNKDRSRKSGGAGLGLSLVKKLTEKQGGIVEVKSKNKEGSIFYVKFPC